MAYHQFPVMDNVQIITPNSCAELSLFVQADHNYSLPVIKEEEFIIDDDLKVVEITEEVDVSMHVGENGTTYLEDTNGVQWNIENTDLFRLNDLPWKPLENIVKTEPEEYVNNVKLVKNCVNCQAPLSSGALCVKCNQPWVPLTDIFKTKEFARYKQIIIKENDLRNVPDSKEKRFYVLKKSDVGNFVNKNMGRLSVINQYDARHFSNMSLGTDVKRKDVTRGNSMGEVSTTKQNCTTSNQNVTEQMKNYINENNKEKSNDTMKVSSSNQSVLNKISIPKNNKKRYCSKRKESNVKFNFIKKYVSVDIDCLNHNLIVKKEVEVQDDNIEDKSKEVTKISDINPYHKTGNVNDDYEDNKMFINIQENEDTEMDNVKDTRTSSKRPCTKRKSALNHRFLFKEKGTLMDILNNDKPEPETKDKEEVVVKFKPRKIRKKKYLCVACDTKFFTYNELHEHMKAHKAPFGCSNCKVKLLSEVELIAHSAVHNILSTKQLKCNLCDKEMKSLSMLRVHSYIHVKNKEFSCEECDASFQTSSKLSLHMIKHGTLPFACNLCKRQFKRSGYLRRHYCPKRWNSEKKSE